VRGGYYRHESGSTKSKSHGRASYQKMEEQVRDKPLGNSPKSSWRDNATLKRTRGGQLKEKKRKPEKKRKGRKKSTVQAERQRTTKKEECSQKWNFNEKETTSN